MNNPLRSQDRYFLDEAYKEALCGLEQGGIPIGAILVVDDNIVSRGHNKRVQECSMIKHGETDCIENTKRNLSPEQLQRSTLYTSLSPCYMCAGTALLFGIKRIVIGENQTFEQSENLLRSMNCEILVANDPKFISMMIRFIRKNPKLWGEDIGKTSSQILKMYENFET
jgi:cytosine/creatinine deaminase